MTDPRAWGIEEGYFDVAGGWHPTPAPTAEALLHAMGAEAERPPGLGADNPVWVVAAGERVRVDGPWSLRTEDGAVSEGSPGFLPVDLPLGYHDLSFAPSGDDERSVTLIVSPRRCHLPEGMHTWGWATQLYALRSEDSWGIGDLADLRRLAGWSAARGAGMCLVNPLHAPLPGLPQQASPYSPSSRCWRNPLYLRIEEIPGAGAVLAGDDLGRAAAAGRALNQVRLIDRDRVWSLKLAALEAIWDATRPAEGMDCASYRAAEGPALDGYATFCALSEVYGPRWRDWPAPVRRPDGPGVAAFVDEHLDRVRFHQWLQQLLDEQLGAAGRELGLMQDLAIGLDPDGADVWYWPDCFPEGVRVGAPPDAFNTQGQDWGLSPFDPWGLRLARYEPFIRTLRAGFRHAGGLRFDHVMGLFRLFWIPPDGTPAAGTYVRYPAAELLDILALESVRAGAYVVGEDLGTVEPSTREELARRAVLSYRVMWFEPEPPARYPYQALAAVTTHDLPTVAGLWSGEDLAAQQRLDLAPNVEGTARLRDRLRDSIGEPDDAPAHEVVLATYRLLAGAPSAVVTASLDDALVVEERPNMPGTVDSWPNWSLALPVPLEDIMADSTVAAIAELMAGRPAPAAG